MDKKQLKARWADARFVNEAMHSLENIFVDKIHHRDADMRGLIVGLDGAMESLMYSDLQDASISNADFSFSQFSCAFNRCMCNQVQYDEAKFDTCRFKGSQFER